MSFGTNILPQMLPTDKLQIMVNVLSNLPYDVLWKWNDNELPGKADNIQISKWYPQSDLLSKFDMYLKENLIQILKCAKYEI